MKQELTLINLGYNPGAELSRWLEPPCPEINGGTQLKTVFFWRYTSSHICKRKNPGRSIHLLSIMFFYMDFKHHLLSNFLT